MRPDLGEEPEIDGIDGLDVLIEEMVNGEVIGRGRGGVGSGLAAHIDRQEKSDRGEEEAGAHRWISFYFVFIGSSPSRNVVCGWGWLFVLDDDGPLDRH